MSIIRLNSEENIKNYDGYYNLKIKSLIIMVWVFLVKNSLLCDCGVQFWLFYNPIGVVWKKVYQDPQFSWTSPSSVFRLCLCRTACLLRSRRPSRLGWSGCPVLSSKDSWLQLLQPNECGNLFLIRCYTTKQNPIGVP